MTDTIIPLDAVRAQRDALRDQIAAQPKSYRPMVRDHASTTFAGNALRFATASEAGMYLIDLTMRWSAVADIRIDLCDDPPNYEWLDGRARPLRPGDPT